LNPNDTVILALNAPTTALDQPIIKHDADLGPHNSFGVSALAAGLTKLERVEQIPAIFDYAATLGTAPPLLLGDGSNVLLLEDYPGLVVINALMGRQLSAEDQQSVLVEIGAGENWDQTVDWSIALGWSGLQNLALIPGRVGAAPIQNIGAYGVEFESVCEQVQIYDRQHAELRWISCVQCAFGYRDSIFKHAGSGWWVTAVRLRLQRQTIPKTDYAGLSEELARLALDATSAADIATAVRSLRRRKLPDPAQIGNAGSFFKNPIVSVEQAKAVANHLPDLPRYPQADGREKLSAGYLIDQAGWKGFRVGDAGVHAAHALVLVNHGSASGRELYELANQIIVDIADRWGVMLTIEPRVIGNLGMR